MRYIVKFTSGNSLHITEDQYNQAMRHEFQSGYINLENVDYIFPQDLIEDGTSGVVTPPTPEELRTRKEEERQKKISDPKALITGIKQKSIDNGDTE